MRHTSGTFFWLVAHDVRLNWRRFTDMLGGAGPRLIVCIAIGGAVILHLAAWPIVLWLSPHIHGQGSAANGPLLATLLVCTFTWMIAQSLFGATRALYDRGDLDLLLGAPQPPTNVVAAKALSIAASTFGSIALLTLPIANIGALLDRPAWLGVYPVLAALALIAAAIGMALTIGLFFLLGARRARVCTHMAGAIIGGAFVLGAQIVAMLPPPLRTTIIGYLEASLLTPVSPLGLLLTLPMQALRGDAGAMALLVVSGLLCFIVVAGLLGERFARASLEAAGAPSCGSNGGAGTWRPKFRAGLATNLRRKEWRLLVRDPSLFAQLGLQIIYTVPIAVVLLRSESLPTVLALAPTIVVIAAQVAASLAWLTVSGEDAPELIQSAPVAPGHVDRGKLSAVALPVFAILVVPLLGLTLASWRAALLTLLFAAAAATSTALVNFWHPMPGNRRGMLRRHSQSKLIALVEHGLAIIWSIAIVFVMLGTWLTIVPILIAIGTMAFFRAKHRNATGNATGRSARSGSTTVPGSKTVPSALAIAVEA